MKVTEARRVNGGLLLETPVLDTAEFLDSFKPGEYEITAKKKKRSLNANSYCWALCEKIAQKTRKTKESVYREEIREVGVYEPLVLREEAVEKFMERWADKGTGWICEVIDDYGTEKLVYAYYGSSTYDTHEMSRLIDNIIQDARALGIETGDEEYINSLLGSWERGK